MKKTFRLLSILILAFQFIQAQPTYDKVINYARLKCVTPLPGGGFIAGGSASLISSNADSYPFLIRINSYGDTLWTKYFIKHHFISDIDKIVVNADSGFTAMVSSHDLTSYDARLLLIRADKYGDTLWTKWVQLPNGSVGGSFPEDICLTHDSCYVITGRLESGTYSGFLIKINPNGSVLWTKKWGNNIAHAVLETNDHGFLVGAGSMLDKLTFIKTDSAGNYLWSKKCYSYGTTYGIHSLCKTIGDTIYAVGDVGNSSNGFAITVSLNQSGNIAWTRTISSLTNPAYQLTYLRRLVIKPDGFLAVGNVYSNLINSGGCIFSISSQGIINWQSGLYLGNLSLNDGLYDIAQNTTGCFATACFGIGTFNRKGVLLKTDSTGLVNDSCTNYSMSFADSISSATWYLPSNITFTNSNFPSPSDTLIEQTSMPWHYKCQPVGVSISEIPSREDFKVYPNPSNGIVNCTINQLNDKEVHLEIRDIAGKLLAESNETKNSFQLDMSNYDEGIYFISVFVNDNQYQQRIIITK